MKAADARAAHFAWRGWFLAALLAALIVARVFAQTPLRPAWLALLAAGLAWRAWAGSHIAGHSNGSAWSGPALASQGPYRISRHPLYFANMLSATGLVLYADCLPAWGELLGLALALAHHEALARAEEAYLLRERGEAYEGYMRVIPRWPWLPRARAARMDTFPPWEGAAAARDHGIGPAGRWRAALARQGWNLAKGGAGAVLLWIAAAVR